MLRRRQGQTEGPSYPHLLNTGTLQRLSLSGLPIETKEREREPPGTQYDNINDLRRKEGGASCMARPCHAMLNTWLAVQPYFWAMGLPTFHRLNTRLSKTMETLATRQG